MTSATEKDINIMTEKSVSDILRELLDERGVEYEVDERNAITEWSTHYGAFVFFARQREGKLLVETTVATKHSVILTPEQAIAATLGSETCENVSDDPCWFECSSCKCTCSIDWLGAGLGEPNHCPNCGKAVKQ